DPQRFAHARTITGHFGAEGKGPDAVSLAGQLRYRDRVLLLFYAYRSLLAVVRANLISVFSVALFVAGGSLGLSYYLSLRGMVTTAPPENVIVVSKGALAERESKLKLETARKIVLLEGIKR